jgi:hypothetical protein
MVGGPASEAEPGRALDSSVACTHARTRGVSPLGDDHAVGPMEAAV